MPATPPRLRNRLLAHRPNEAVVPEVHDRHDEGRAEEHADRLHGDHGHQGPVAQGQSDEERDEESEREYKHIISEIHILRDEIREMRASDTKPT